MKVIFFFLLIMLAGFGQISAQKSKKEKKKDKLENLSPQARHDAYLQMANNQKLLGWFGVGLGGSMVIGGAAKMMSESFKGVSKTDIRLIWLPVAGVLIGGGGYYIVKNSKEKRKKAALILEQESACLGNPQHIPSFSYPAIGVRFTIR